MRKSLSTHRYLLIWVGGISDEEKGGEGNIELAVENNENLAEFEILNVEEATAELRAGISIDSQQFST